jgi:hypothetical protein
MQVESLLNLNLDLNLLHSLRPCLGKGASWRAGGGWVRMLAFLSILRECSIVVPHVPIIEVFAGRNSFP